VDIGFFYWGYGGYSIMAIDEYSISGYWWLLVVINGYLLVVIVNYFTIYYDYW